MLAKPLSPRRPGRPLFAIMIGRISTEHQNESNIEASIDYVDDFLRRNYDGPINVKRLGERASGMLADRPTMREAQEIIDSGECDVVIVEELSRLYRNPGFAYRFVQDCVDCGVRVIAIGDNLDTADENWEATMSVATLRHSMHIPDTRRRVRRTATSSFAKGGMVLKVRFGYRKLTKQEAESGMYGPAGLRMAKLVEFTPVIREMASKFIEGWSFTRIAEWLNARGVPPPPYGTLKRWSRNLVRDLLFDPILGGVRTFRDTLSQQIFSTGKHRSVPNPNGPEQDIRLELAHLEPELYDSLRQALAERCPKRSADGQQSHCRLRIARSRTIFPGQQMTCQICEAIYYAYGTDEFKCQNSRRGVVDRCWNHVQVDGRVVRELALRWLVERLDSFPDFRRTLAELVLAAFHDLHADRQRSSAAIEQQLQSLRKKAEHYGRAVGEGESSPTLIRLLRETEAEIGEIEAKRDDQQASLGHTLDFVDPAIVEKHLAEALIEIAGKSHDFSDLTRQLFSKIVVVPVQEILSGLVRPRLKLTLCVRTDDAAESEQCFDGIIDAFEAPVHIKHLEVVVKAREEHPTLTLRQLAEIVGINYMTVKRSLDLSRLLSREGLASPYVELHAAPQNASRWRHRSSNQDGEVNDEMDDSAA